MRGFLAAMAFPNAIWAECLPQEDPFLSCRFDNGKAVEVCLTEETARYSFGRPGQAPELALTLAFGGGAEFVPWNGVGRDIWEAVRLTNNAITYEVYGGFDRMTAADDSVVSHFGGIVVLDAKGVELAHLICRPETVSYAY
ncbi:MAG: Mitochondrial ribosomal protein L51 / S25 / CI-B8 domain [Rhodobacteraceae bacterium HLUCCA08]|nr:MAG: Mitochondrial ribosomal protein L51 / S25 / CI-B8 domain [Rhodobacteraceae bacterium HLUCCA08]